MFYLPFFNPQPADLMLAEKEIHIWHASLDVSISEFYRLSNTLSTDESLRAEKYYFEKDRRRFIVGRGILRSILGSYLDIEPSWLQFCYGNNGKPAIADRFCRRTIRFNLSHSDGVALFAFTLGREMGIDIEKVRDISEMEQIAERFFSAREYSLFCSLPGDKRREAFFTCWTRKESFIKAVGDGLALPLNSFEVLFKSGEPAKVLNTNGDKKEWFLSSFMPCPGYIGALAVEGEGRRLVDLKWDNHRNETLLLKFFKDNLSTVSEIRCDFEGKEKIL